jgi:glycosyltransferase involved in cell wall biosynthesis
VKEMTESILQVLTRPQKLDQMGQQARKKSEEYSVDAYVRVLERLYEELVTNDAPQGN